MNKKYVLVAIGASQGGLDAVCAITRNLTRGFAATVVVVQHVAPGPSRRMAVSMIERNCALPVSEVQDKDPVTPGEVVVAPSGYHLLVDDGWFSLSTEEPVINLQPSVDVLFESVADRYKERAIGVVLSGYGFDGAEGIRMIHERGGLTVAMDPDEALVPEMPLAAIATGDVAHVLPTEDIGRLITDICETTERIAE